MKRSTIIFALFIGLAALFTPLKAQEIDANVTVNMEQLTQEARVNVSTMESDVEDYLDNQKFTDMEWEGPKIEVEVSIYLQGGGGGSYSARLFIVSKRVLDGPEAASSINVRTVDDKWSFEYSRFANLSYNPRRFHEFTSLLDFYMLVIIGMDLDTYGELQGAPMYETAKEIVRLGNAKDAEGYSVRTQMGAFTRYNLVRELTDMRFEPLRKLFFAYYYDGLDLMAFEKEKAVQGLRSVVDDMVRFKDDKLMGPSALLQFFFNAKHKELADIFKGHDDEAAIFKELKYLDPEHISYYNEVLDR